MKTKVLSTWVAFFSIAALAHAAWYKGNTHTHTLNSDGDATPDVAARWYREHGYQFVVITDHDYLTDVAPLNALYARDDQFIVIPGEEVTQHIGKSRDPSDPTNRPTAHVNGINLRKPVVPLGGTYGTLIGYAPPEVTMAETYARNIKEITAAGGIAQVNHPNWRWSVRWEDIQQLPDGILFEIWNGLSEVNNLGGTDDQGNVAPSTEALWDRLLSEGKRIWGVGTDDSHFFYHLDERKGVNPGQAWVVVRADKLTPDNITASLAKGDFYASTGIELEQLSASTKEMFIEIKSRRQGPRFTTKFIGENGKVLAEIPGTRPRYQIKGDEGYVRAVITDSNGWKAWIQPVFLDGQKSVALTGK